MTSSSFLAAVPWLLTTFRLVLAPVLVVAVWADAPGELFLVCIPLAFLSDLFDGILARRFGVSTPTLRRYDSVADVVFYLTVLWAIWVRHPQVAADYVGFIFFFLTAEVLCQAISLVRFGHTTATHAWCCKAWAVLLSISLTLLLGRGIEGCLLRLTVALGCIAYLDVLLILLLAVESPVDVPSAWHVWQTRRAQMR